MENEKKHQKKIDLTLKLSSYDENGEERRLTRSSSVMGEGSRVQGDSSLGRTSSLPAEALPAEALPAEAERQVMVALLSPSMFALLAASSLNGYTPSTLPPLTTYLNPSQISGFRGLIHSTDGSINSMASQEISSLRPGDTKLGNPDKLGNYCSLKGDVMEILSQMPSVSTTGDGPNGKRIEGFLYKYRNGEVCIVCICHGNFFTPAEFVMHAGGKKVANPMKHITVSFNSF